MVDTAIFSIFHRAPPPPRPDPVETAAPLAAPPPAPAALPPEPPPVVHHPEPVAVAPPQAPAVADATDPPASPPEPIEDAAPLVHGGATPPETIAAPPEYPEPPAAPTAEEDAEPHHGQPEPVEPEQTAPGQPEPEHIEAAHAEPLHVEPDHAEPHHVEPAPAEPDHAEPRSVDPVPPETIAEQHAHQEPNAAEHVAPEHVEPEHVEPEQVELELHVEPDHIEPDDVAPPHAGAVDLEPHPIAGPHDVELDHFEPEPPGPDHLPDYETAAPIEAEPGAPEPLYAPHVELPFEGHDAPAPASAEADTGEPAWTGPAALSGIPLEADQLGLANPVIITLLARLRDSPAMELDASQSGIYRPNLFRPAPWSGFAYDQAADGRTGVAAGTRILTSRGELEVERLLPGDTAMTLREPALLPIAWIGRSIATAPPIWIEAGALGPNLPRRDLCLAPDQPVYLEPVPVPAERLVNGSTIRRLVDAAVDMFHIDVGQAEILFAEGVPLSSSDRVRVQAA